MENENIVVIVLVIVLLIFFSGFGMMGFSGYETGGMMNCMFGTGSGSMWIFGWLFMSLIVIALTLFIFWLIKQLQSPRK